MAAITAIELGADTCALARTSVRRGEVRLLAAEILDPAAFPGAEAFTSAVQQTRRGLRLPRRCRVVVWGLPEGASREDTEVKPILAPLVAAGFKVERVVSPCNALAALARVKASRGTGSMCWIAINRGGVAIVVVRPGTQLYARSFAWDWTIGATGSQARLLQRYSLVSFLSPEVKRAMAEARAAGSPVDVVVTCGNLPDLRSLTMPLIEELDIEVEPLDSLEGLAVKPEAADKLAALAPAIRLACAAAIARGTRPWDPTRKRGSRAGTYLRAAALAVMVAGLAYLWYVMTQSAAPVASPPQSQQVRAPLPSSHASAPPAGSRTPIGTPSRPANVPAAPPKANPVAAPAGAPKPIAPAVTTPVIQQKPGAPATPAPVVPSKSNPPAVGPPAAPPQSSPVVPAPGTRNPPPAAIPRPNAVQPSTRGPATTGSAPPAAPKPTPPAPGAVPPASRTGGGLNTPASRADKPETGPPARAVGPDKAGVPLTLSPTPLTDPIPRVTAILVSRDRRYATLAGGQIVGIGDLLGRRRVVGMDERSLVLQEPSGVQIRVGLGGRLLGVERSAR